MKSGQNVCLGKIFDESENVSCRVKTRSLSQLLEKPCLHSRGHISCPILMKLGQNVFLDEISEKLENGSCQVKNEVTRSNLRFTI